LFYKHFEVSFANTLFFAWAAAILYLKLLKLKHQRQAMLLDVLPRALGNEINAGNVSTFIDHVYGLPERLRDSLMVNRIRKALEFFEVRQNVADVSMLMASQSAIDGSRIMGSYIIVRAFLWAIPLLGFIGTVIGLSGAISGMSFSNVEDVSKIVGSINNVTSGLGTAFDATLLGLIFAVFLNFPSTRLPSMRRRRSTILMPIATKCCSPDSGTGPPPKRSMSTRICKAWVRWQTPLSMHLPGRSRSF
jgi:MotA/TolQ/ExbB proton channel family